jgi:hypothetical protein
MTTGSRPPLPAVRPDAARDKILATIATEHLRIETLVIRNSDSLDFHDVGVASLKDALKAAYAAGRASVGT